MNRTLVRSLVCALFSCSALFTQSMSASTDMPAAPSDVAQKAVPVRAYVNPHQAAVPSSIAPFSRIGLAGGISAIGINMQAAVNVNRHLNVRGVGNFFNYNANNLSVSGFTVNGKLNLATAGASLDVFPWARHGFHLSPGMLFHNRNGMIATMLAAGGTSFTLNGYTYYSSTANPVQGTASFGLHKQNPAPMVTLGWGNLISRGAGHWSFPVEIGAAYTGAPTIAMGLTGGQVCADPQGTIACLDVVGNSDINTNLQAQIAKYQKDVNPYPFTPIVSFGVGYNFGIRKHRNAAGM